MCFKNKFDLLTNFSISFDRKKMKFRHMSTEKASDFPSQNISCDGAFGPVELPFTSASICNFKSP